MFAKKYGHTLIDLLQAGLQGRRDHPENVAARVKLFWRNCHEGLAQLLRVACGLPLFALPSDFAELA